MPKVIDLNASMKHRPSTAASGGEGSFDVSTMLSILPSLTKSRFNNRAQHRHVKVVDHNRSAKTWVSYHMTTIDDQDLGHPYRLAKLGQMRVTMYAGSPIIKTCDNRIHHKKVLIKARDAFQVAMDPTCIDRWMDITNMILSFPNQPQSARAVKMERCYHCPGADDTRMIFTIWGSKSRLMLNVSRGHDDCHVATLWLLPFGLQKRIRISHMGLSLARLNGSPRIAREAICETSISRLARWAIRRSGKDNIDLASWVISLSLNPADPIVVTFIDPSTGETRIVTRLSASASTKTTGNIMVLSCSDRNAASPAFIGAFDIMTMLPIV